MLLRYTFCKWLADLPTDDREKHRESDVRRLRNVLKHITAQMLWPVSDTEDRGVVGRCTTLDNKQSIGRVHNHGPVVHVPRARVAPIVPGKGNSDSR